MLTELRRDSPQRPENDSAIDERRAVDSSSKLDSTPHPLSAVIHAFVSSSESADRMNFLCWVSAAGRLRRKANFPGRAAFVLWIVAPSRVASPRTVSLPSWS